MLAVGVLLVIVSNALALPATFHGFMINLRFMAERTIFGYIPEFAIGIGCGLWYNRHGAPGKRRAWWLLTTGVLGLLAVMTAVSHTDNVDVQPFGWIISIFAGLLILGLTNTETIIARVMSHPIPVYLGRISFALYLLHTGPLVAVSRTLPSPVFYAFGNIVAAIFHELVEKPGHKLVMALGRRKPAKISPPEPVKNS
jgi:peptidoglycan/LPS O-acetylase OafA/YrhL